MFHAKRPSATKKGPGRYHKDGQEKDKQIKPRGTPFGFEQHTSYKAPSRRDRHRADVAARKSAGLI